MVDCKEIYQFSRFQSALGRQSKTLITIDERGQKSLETLFSVAIFRQSGDKMAIENYVSYCF